MITDISYLPYEDIPMKCLLRTLPIEDQPRKGLWYQGNPALLQQNWAGFTGTETPTQGAIEDVYAWASFIASLGYPIVSGGCPGIDTAAHRAAVDNGLPTIVILPHSLHERDYYRGRVTKSTNIALYEKVLENNGLLLSAYETGDTWHGKTNNPIRQWRTTERNQYIAASMITIAGQWDAPKSGTMSTIWHAKRLRREVLVPAPRPEDIEHHLDQCAGTVQYLKEHNQHGLTMDDQTGNDQAWLEEHLQEIASASRAWTARR